MSNPTPDSIQNITTDIDAVKLVERRREMLERIANIVNAIQRLTSSLETLLHSSGSNPNIADKAFGLLDYLDDKQKQLTTGKIEIRLEAIDDRIRDELSQILSEIHHAKGSSFAEQSSNENGEEAEDPLEIVSEFRRKVRLSMAYRLLLVERGAEIHPINLDVAPELISACIKKLQKEEKQYTNKLLIDIKRFKEEVKVLVNNNKLTTRIRDALAAIGKQLSESMHFIKEHTPVDTLPELFDMASFMNAGQSDNAGSNSEQEEMASELGKPTTKNQSKGFFNTLNKWLSTPMDVSWKEAKKKE